MNTSIIVGISRLSNKVTDFFMEILTFFSAGKGGGERNQTKISKKREGFSLQTGKKCV